MKAKTITAKIRDAVPVCFMVNDDEMARYKNIEIPAELKELEIMDFGFSEMKDGKIDFNLYFEPGILPKEFPAPRARVTRAEKAAAKVAKIETAAAMPTQETTPVKPAAPAKADKKSTKDNSPTYTQKKEA